MKIRLLLTIILLTILIVFIPCTVTAKITSVSGATQVLALDDNGTVWAWGNNMNGELGIGTMGGYYAIPQKVLIDNITAISAGGSGVSSSFALKSDGTVWAWGYGDDGRLGYGGYESQSTPVQVKNLTNVIAIAAGEQACFALKSDGTVWAWGDNEYGQLGDGTTSGDGTTGIKQYIRITPVQVKGLTGVKALGEHGYFAIKDDGTVYAWGDNTYSYDDSIYGALGDTSGPGIRPTPFQVKGVSSVKQITSEMNGHDATIYVKNDNTVWAWGTNDYGAVGDGTIKDSWLPDIRQPSVQLNLANVLKVSSLGSHTIALKSDGTVWFWGRYIDRRGPLDNSGLPPTDNGGEPSPVKINGLNHIIDISSGSMCSIVLKDDGSVWGWGRNDEKELGNTKNDVEPYPIMIWEGPVQATPTPMASAIVASTPSPTPANESQATSVPAQSHGTPIPTPGFTFDMVAVLGCMLIVTGLLAGHGRRKDD